MIRHYASSKIVREGSGTIAQWVEKKAILAPRCITFSIFISNIDILWAVSDRTVFNPQARQYILLNTLRNKVPFMGLSASYVKAGALFALSLDYEDIGYQTGELASRIIAGEQTSSISIPEYPSSKKISASHSLISFESKSGWTRPFHRPLVTHADSNNSIDRESCDP